MSNARYKRNTVLWLRCVLMVLPIVLGDGVETCSGIAVDDDPKKVFEDIIKARDAYRSTIRSIEFEYESIRRGGSPRKMDHYITSAIRYGKEGEKFYYESTINNGERTVTMEAKYNGKLLRNRGPVGDQYVVGQSVDPGKGRFSEPLPEQMMEVVSEELILRLLENGKGEVVSAETVREDNQELIKVVFRIQDKLKVVTVENFYDIDRGYSMVKSRGLIAGMVVQEINLKIGEVKVAGKAYCYPVSGKSEANDGIGKDIEIKEFTIEPGFLKFNRDIPDELFELEVSKEDELWDRDSRKRLKKAGQKLEG